MGSISSKNLSTINDNICCLCLEGIPDDIITWGDRNILTKTKCCKNIMHKKCLNECLKKSKDCPMCRGDLITGSQLLYTYNPDDFLSPFDSVIEIISRQDINNGTFVAD